MFRLDKEKKKERIQQSSTEASFSDHEAAPTRSK